MDRQICLESLSLFVIFRALQHIFFVHIDVLRTFWSSQFPSYLCQMFENDCQTTFDVLNKRIVIFEYQIRFQIISKCNKL